MSDMDSGIVDKIVEVIGHSKHPYGVPQVRDDLAVEQLFPGTKRRVVESFFENQNRDREELMISVEVDPVSDTIVSVTRGRFDFLEKEGFPPERLLELLPALCDADASLVSESKRHGLLFYRTFHTVELLIPGFKPLRKKIPENEFYWVKPRDLKAIR